MITANINVTRQIERIREWTRTLEQSGIRYLASDFADIEAALAEAKKENERLKATHKATIEHERFIAAREAVGRLRDDEGDAFQNAEDVYAILAVAEEENARLSAEVELRNEAMRYMPWAREMYCKITTCGNCEGAADETKCLDILIGYALKHAESNLCKRKAAALKAAEKKVGDD